MVEISEVIGGNEYILASTPIIQSQLPSQTKITFSPTSSEVKVKFKYGTSAWTWHGHSICITKPVMVSETYYVDVCDETVDKYRFGFNGMEKDNEMKGIGNSLDFGARMYDSRMGRWMSVDPLMKQREWMSPYNFVQNNPITRVDPTGALDDEYDKKGNKISELGGDKIDFYHQSDGHTKIVDRETGVSNIINNGTKYIEGFTHRSKEISWRKLFSEFDLGIGPTKSLIYDFDNSTVGVFSSLDKPFSIYAGKAREEVLNDKFEKNKIKFDYYEINPLTAGLDGWEQFIGRPNLSYYKLGDKVLFMMTDSKSMTSLMYRMSPNWERKQFPLRGNTYQTYIWTESISEIKQKSQVRANRIKEREKLIKETKNWGIEEMHLYKW